MCVNNKNNKRNLYTTSRQQLINNCHMVAFDTCLRTCVLVCMYEYIVVCVRACVNILCVCVRSCNRCVTLLPSYTTANNSTTIYCNYVITTTTTTTTTNITISVFCNIVVLYMCVCVIIFLYGINNSNKPQLAFVACCRTNKFLWNISLQTHATYTDRAADMHKENMKKKRRDLEQASIDAASDLLDTDSNATFAMVHIIHIYLILQLSVCSLSLTSITLFPANLCS